MEHWCHGISVGTVSVLHMTHQRKVNQSHYSPEVPRGFQEVKVPTLRDNGPEWW